MHAIGIDIGGTKIAGAVVSELGEILAEDRVATNAADPDAMLDDVVTMVTRLRASHEVSAVGVAAPGFIDAHTHDDRLLFADPQVKAKASQGVTTVVVGNCGISLAPFLSGGATPPPPSTVPSRSTTKYADRGAA